MTIAQEEIFGPVLVRDPVRRRRRRRAHRQRHRLRPVGRRDVRLARSGRIAVARRIRTGTIGVNGGIWYGADSPFGGYKASGIGRQNGLEGFEQYLETKAIAGPAPPTPTPAGGGFLS